MFLRSLSWQDAKFNELDYICFLGVHMVFEVGGVGIYNMNVMFQPLHCMCEDMLGWCCLTVFPCGWIKLLM